MNRGNKEMRKFSVEFTNEPWRNTSFMVRGICKFDVLNPCWDNRKSDIPGKHWGVGLACEPCTKAANELKCSYAVDTI